MKSSKMLRASTSRAMPSKVCDVVRAAMNGNVEAIKSIVRQKIDAEGRDGRTPLMMAALRGQHKCLDLLLGYGAEPNRSDCEGNTALHECCFNADIKTAQILLDHDAGINIKNNKGDTPLHLAAYECNVEVVEFLLKNGSQSAIRNDEKQTPVQKLQLSPHSNNYSDDRARKIVALIKEWNEDNRIKKFKATKSMKEETMQGIADIEKNVTGMTKQVTELVETVHRLAACLDTTTHQLEATEEKAKKFEKVLQDILEHVKIPAEFITDSTNAGKKLDELMAMTNNNYDNLCQTHEFDRVFSTIFLKIAEVVGKIPDLWKDLARNLYRDYLTSFVNNMLNTITANHQDDEKRAHECLLHWKIFVGTYVDKIEPLKAIIEGMDFAGKQALVKEIDDIMEDFRKMSYEEPVGSLTEESLARLGKQLGNKWQEMGHHLDFTNTEVGNFQTNFPLPEDRSRQMLKKWVQRESGFNRAKLGRLCEALKRIGRVDLVSKLTL